MSAAFDIAVAVLAARQGQVFTRAQALELGGTPRMVDHRLATGRWQRLAAGVYAPAGAVVDLTARRWAACLHRRDSVLSHEAAGELHSVPAVPTGRCVITVESDQAHTSPFATVHRTNWLPSNHVTTLDGLPVTDRVKTLLDLSAVLGPKRYAHVLGHELASHAVKADELIAAYETWTRRGRRRSAHFARLVQPFLAPGPPLNALETAYLMLVNAAGLPLPDAQVRLGWLPPEPGTVDFAYPALRVLVEVDGKTWHTRDAAYDRDRRRDAEATIRGWMVLRFTWRQVMFEPEYVLATLRRALVARSAA